MSLLPQSVPSVLSVAAVVASAVLTALIAGCGQGDAMPSGYEQLDALATASEAQARALGVNRPCSDVSQCGKLMFQPTHGTCAQPVVHVYSTVSATARQAEAAASAQNAAAAKAWPLQPGGVNTNVACIAGFADPPLACAAGVCTTDAGVIAQ